ncbi:hypothetical protein ISCGN_015114 [Ixodes scapularis]
MFAWSLLAFFVSAFMKYRAHSAAPTENSTISTSSLRGSFILDRASGGHYSPIENITVYAAQLNFTSDNLSLSRYEHELGSLLDIARRKSSDFVTESTLDAREKGEDHTDVSTPIRDAGQATEDARDVNRSVELQEATYADTMIRLPVTIPADGPKENDLPPRLHAPSLTEPSSSSQQQACNRTASLKPGRSQTPWNISSDALKRLSRSKLPLQALGRRNRRQNRTRNGQRNVKSILSNINATEEEIISALEDEALARERKEAPGIVSLRERGCLPVESSPAVQDRATCPFRFITTFDKRRLPSLLVTVQCMCKGTPCSSRRGYRCVQISKPVSMMRRIGKIYSEMLEEVPLACVCAYVGPGVRNNFY